MEKQSAGPDADMLNLEYDLLKKAGKKRLFVKNEREKLFLNHQLCMLEKAHSKRMSQIDRTILNNSQKLTRVLSGGMYNGLDADEPQIGYSLLQNERDCGSRRAAFTTPHHSIPPARMIEPTISVDHRRLLVRPRASIFTNSLISNSLHRDVVQQRVPNLSHNYKINPQRQVSLSAGPARSCKKFDSRFRSMSVVEIVINTSESVNPSNDTKSVNQSSDPESVNQRKDPESVNPSSDPESVNQSNGPESFNQSNGPETWIENAPDIDFNNNSKWQNSSDYKSSDTLMSEQGWDVERQSEGNQKLRKGTRATKIEITEKDSGTDSDNCEKEIKSLSTVRDVVKEESSWNKQQLSDHRQDRICRRNFVHLSVDERWKKACEKDPIKRLCDQQRTSLVISQEHVHSLNQEKKSLKTKGCYSSSFKKRPMDFLKLPNCGQYKPEYRNISDTSQLRAMAPAVTFKEDAVAADRGVREWSDKVVDPTVRFRSRSIVSLGQSMLTNQHVSSAVDVGMKRETMNAVPVLLQERAGRSHSISVAKSSSKDIQYPNLSLRRKTYCAGGLKEDTVSIQNRRPSRLDAQANQLPLRALGESRTEKFLVNRMLRRRVPKETIEEEKQEEKCLSDMFKEIENCHYLRFPYSKDDEVKSPI